MGIIINVEKYEFDRRHSKILVLEYKCILNYKLRISIKAKVKIKIRAKLR